MTNAESARTNNNFNFHQSDVSEFIVHASGMCMRGFLRWLLCHIGHSVCSIESQLAPVDNTLAYHISVAQTISKHSENGGRKCLGSAKSDGYNK